MEKFNECVNKRKTDINSELFEKDFNYERASEIVETSYNSNNRKKNNDLVNKIKSWLSDLKNEIADMSEESKETKNLNEIINIVENILKFIWQNQEGQGLKILTLNQMLSRLPIALAQLKAENNTEKLKNEIRQILYSFYRSKKFTKKIYKSLIDII